MHVFRVVLKDKNAEGGANYVDLGVTLETSLVLFAQSVKAIGGVCNEGVVIPYENILYVTRMDVVDAPNAVSIHSPAQGMA